VPAIADSMGDDARPVEEWFAPRRRPATRETTKRRLLTSDAVSEKERRASTGSTCAPQELHRYAFPFPFRRVFGSRIVGPFSVTREHRRGSERRRDRGARRQRMAWEVLNMLISIGLLLVASLKLRRGTINESAYGPETPRPRSRRPGRCVPPSTYTRHAPQCAQ